MTIHLVKLSVGAETVDDLRAWVEKRSRQSEEAGEGKVHQHVTRMHPRRTEELLNGGSNLLGDQGHCAGAPENSRL